MATHFLYIRQLGAIPFLLAALYFYYRAYQEWKANRTTVKTGPKKHS